MSNNWIFLRGLTRGNIHWGKLPQLLLNNFPDDQFEFMELPGNGNLNHLQTPKTAEEIILYLRKNSQLINEQKKCHLVGISLGGMISLKWAELFPEEINSVTIINCSFKQFSPFYERLLSKNYLKIVSGLLIDSTADKEALILKITSNKSEAHLADLERFKLFAKDHPVSIANFVRQLMLASQIKFNQIPSVRLKIIVSKNDRLVSPECSEKIYAGLGGDLFIHPTAGHDLPLDEPEWLCEILRK